MAFGHDPAQPAKVSTDISLVAIDRSDPEAHGLAEVILRKARVPKQDRIHWVLFSGYKNLGLTATLAIALFEPIVAVPATICIMFEVIWIIAMTKYYPKVTD